MSQKSFVVEIASTSTKLIVVGVFAIAMAWVEACVVLDLRTMVNRLDPYQHEPLPEMGVVGRAELLREVATLVMLATVGWLAGTTRRSRFGYALVAFGIWDIFYYVFLRPLTGWPKSLLDWDVLFLLPLPWWGPVLAPVLVSIVMVTVGVLMVEADRKPKVSWPGPWTIAAAFVGMVLVLYTFLADALGAAKDGEKALREMLPIAFHWPIFTIGLVLMALPAVALARQHRPVKGTCASGSG